MAGTEETFEEAGFLSREARRGRHGVRGANSAWFTLAHDLNAVMVAAASAAASAVNGHNWTRQAVAVRLLLRTTTTFQAVVLLSERGMVAPSRALVRTIVEDSLCAAALESKPDDVIRMLKEDWEHSRRGQAKFISEQQLGDDPVALANLQTAAGTMDKKPRINWKELACLTSMLPQYLNYLRLSDGAVHTSASSLERHVVRHPEREGWAFGLDVGEPADVAATLHRAVLGAMPVAIVVTQIIPDPGSNVALATLGERFQRLPTGSIV
jgi:hypothetical protein